MNNSTLVYNPNNMHDLANLLETGKGKFDEIFEEMFSLVMRLNSSFEGQDYDAFRSKFESFKANNVDRMSAELEQWSKDFNVAANEAEDNTRANVSRIENAMEFNNYKG